MIEPMINAIPQSERFLHLRGPDAVLRAREFHPKIQEREYSKGISLFGCYFVVPLRDRWHVIVQHRMFESSNPIWIAEFWRSTVAPILVDEWSKGAPKDRQGLAQELLGLRQAFPKGLLASDWQATRRCEIWHAGDLEPWMGVTPRTVEEAFDAQKQWTWIKKTELACDPDAIASAMKLLDLPHAWKPLVDSPR